MVALTAGRRRARLAGDFGKGLQPNKRSAPEIRADGQIQGSLGGVKDKKTIAECCEAGEAGGAGRKRC